MAAHNDTGKWGEEVAVSYLEHLGYCIRHTDWRIGKRDLDIVAVSEEQQLVFVEVKTRTDTKFTSPLEAVDRQKIRNLAVAAHAYLKVHPFEAEVRFDITPVVGSDAEHCKVVHVQDAFNPLLL